MTRKDFEIIAGAVSRAAVDEAARRTVAYTLAGALLVTNPRFDLPRFVAACGVDA